jgi:DNA-binding response OmpR family regulator
MREAIERRDERKETAMRRILVVDDDPHVGQAIRVWLEHHGFRVATAESASGGLAALDNATFDLMIVDVFMPHMRGFEAIRTKSAAAMHRPRQAAPAGGRHDE